MLKALEKRQLTGKRGFLLSSLHTIQYVLNNRDDPEITEEMIYRAMDLNILIGENLYFTYAARDNAKIVNKDNQQWFPTGSFFRET